jgi:glycosyl transferase, family 25
MQAFLINLAQDRERLTHMTAQLEQHDIAFERIEAVDGTAMSEAAFAAFANARTGKQTPWSRGQAGCFLSHVLAWQRIAEGTDAYAVVMEDDIHFSADAGSILARSDWIPADAGIVRLEVSLNAVLLARRAAGTILDRSVHRLRSTAWSTGGYVISRQTAKWLLALGPERHRAADAFLFSRELSPTARELNIYQMSPAIVIQDCLRQHERMNFASHTSMSNAPLPGSTFSPWRLLNLRRVLRALAGYRRLSYQP